MRRAALSRPTPPSISRPSMAVERPLRIQAPQRPLALTGMRPDLGLRFYAKKKAPRAELAEGVADAKQNALLHALKSIEQSYGKGAIMRMDEKLHRYDLSKVISTGSLSIDLALGIGGLPRGRIVEIYGPEMSGKTTFALQVLANAQMAGGTCVFIDAEHALSIEYARKLNIDTDKLYVSQPDDGEQALEIADTLVRSGGVDVIVIDSVAALTPKTELAGDMGDQQIGLQARLMSKALRKLTASINKTDTLVILINQIRHKIGVMFGSPEVTTGGNALRFYASVRMEVRKVGAIKKGDAVVGHQVKVKITKNKLAPPFRVAEVDLEYGKGTSKAGELVDLGIQYGVLNKSGAWISYGERQLGQGKEKVKALLEEDRALSAEIEAKIKDAVGDELPTEGEEVEEGEEDMEPEEEPLE